MLGNIKRIVAAKDPTLGFYEEHIRPIVTRRWNIMNTQLHMAAFVLNPKWYAQLGGRGLPCDDPEVLAGFTRAIDKMYSAQDASTLRAQFLDFTTFVAQTWVSHKQGWIELFWHREILLDGGPGMGEIHLS